MRPRLERRAGRSADFLVLDENPLADVENTRSMVVQQGVYFDETELADLRRSSAVE